jgi:hypothetical protein
MHNFNAEKKLTTVYGVECFKPNGELRWQDNFHNIVVEEGINDSLDKHFKGSGYTAAWYVGLASAAPTFAYDDSMSSHGGWTEAALYGDAQRPGLNLGNVGGGSVSNSASKATFSINADGTIGGAFVTTGSAKSSPDLILYGGGSFTSGDRAVINGDTVNVTVTLSGASTTA